MKFISDVTFPSWPGKSVNPQFSQYQSYKNNYKFTCCFKCHQKTALIISITTHSHLLRKKIVFLSDVTFPSWPGKPVNPQFSQYQSYKNNYIFTCCFKCHQKMAGIISITTHSVFLREINCFLI